MGLESLKKKSVLFDFAEGCSQWGTELLNQGTPCHPKWCHCQGRRLFTGCELRGQLPCAADASLGRTHLICTEMGTLGLVWHIFECFYYLYKPKFWRVSGLKASLSLWIMNLNAAFCVDYLMIHSNIAVASGCAEKIQDVFRWHLWCMAFLLWFIIQRYSIWKANSLIPSDRLFFFSVKKAMSTSLEEYQWERGAFFACTWFVRKQGWL